VRNEATNEIRHQYLSAERARRVLGWRPLFTLEEGLGRTIEWYTDFFRASAAEPSTGSASDLRTPWR
jgi:CDP-glucose 4,6-dehydratase